MTAQFLLFERAIIYFGFVLALPFVHAFDRPLLGKSFDLPTVHFDPPRPNFTYTNDHPLSPRPFINITAQRVSWNNSFSGVICGLIQKKDTIIEPEVIIIDASDFIFHEGNF